MSQYTQPSPNRLTWLVTFTTIAAVHCVAAGQGTPPPADAVQNAQALLNEGKADEALRFIDQHLIQRRVHSAGEERFQLLMMKGDAMIRTNKATMAASVFDQARRAAPNGQSAAVARANSLLVRAAPGGKYTPRSRAAEPIDLVNPDSRRAAFDAFRADLLAQAKPKMDRATQAKTLPPALDVLPAILDIASVELASKGTTDETRADVSALSEHARGLMRGQLDLAHRRINTLGDLASRIEDGERRQLQSNEVKELPPMIAELRRIEKAARDVRSRAQELGIAATAWEQIAIDAADLADAAERISEFGAPSVRD